MQPRSRRTPRSATRSGRATPTRSGWRTARRAARRRRRPPPGRRAWEIAGARRREVTADVGRPGSPVVEPVRAARRMGPDTTRREPPGGPVRGRGGPRRSTATAAPRDAPPGAEHPRMVRGAWPSRSGHGRCPPRNGSRALPSPLTPAPTSRSSAPASPACGPRTTSRRRTVRCASSSIDAEHVGFGASGRNGGWCSGLLPVALTKLADVHGRYAATAMQRAMYDTVAEVRRVCEQEGIDAGLAHGGMLTLARDRRPGAPAAGRAEREPPLRVRGRRRGVADRGRGRRTLPGERRACR